MPKRTEQDLTGADAHAVTRAAPHSDKAFRFGNPDNFALLIDGLHLSVLGGKPCSVGKFDTPLQEKEWIVWNLGFQRHVLERLARYSELRLAELQINEAELTEKAHKASSP